MTEGTSKESRPRAPKPGTVDSWKGTLESGRAVPAVDASGQRGFLRRELDKAGQAIFFWRGKAATDDQVALIVGHTTQTISEGQKPRTDKPEGS